MERGSFRSLLILFFLWLLTFPLVAQNFGDGSDGDVTFSSNTTYNHVSTTLTGDNLSGQPTVNISSTAGFSVGDEVFIIQMANAISEVGNFEEAVIASVNATSLTLTQNLTNDYRELIGGNIAQIIKIPQYGNVTVNAGVTVTVPAWDGNSGGILIFKALGTVDIQGNIDVTGKGFRGGTLGTNGSGGSGGTAGIGVSGGDGGNGGNTGTGGTGGDNSPPFFSRDGGDGGAFGGNGTTGSTGGAGDGPSPGANGDGGTNGGTIISSAFTNLKMGSGGGGGRGGDGGRGAGGGGAGGGANGAAIAGANGTSGGTGGDGGNGGIGGNGGGIVRIIGYDLTISGSVLADGNNGGTGSDGTIGGTGGDGGDGVTSSGFPVENGSGGGGGNGGEGGDGGNGGGAGAGGSIWITAAKYQNNGSISISAGNPGSGGGLGSGGPGGSMGLGGTLNDGGSIFPAPNGQTGNTGPDGTAGPTGNNNAGDGLLAIELVADPLIVTNTNDTGIGSLRYAIDFANQLSTPQIIIFNISGSGPFYIRPNTPFSAVTNEVTIDGYSQTGSSKNTLSDAIDAVLQIVVDGSNLSSGSGFDIQSDNTLIDGLSIIYFPDHGIEINTVSSVSIQGNFIGVPESGDLDAPNSRYGIFINNSNGCTIGGNSPEFRNIITSNILAEVSLQGSSATNNTISGNIIGLDITGTNAQAVNNTVGILIDNAPANTIGGTAAAERNFISDHQDGIIIQGSGSTGNIVQGNYFGTDVLGLSNVKNSSTCIYINSGANNNTIGGINASEGNLMANSDNHNILVDGSSSINNTIRGNAIYCSGSDNVFLQNSGNANYSTPTIDFVSADSISGTATANATVDLYYDYSGCGSPGSTSYVTSVTSGGSGFWFFNTTGVFNPGEPITANATSSSGNSSGYSSVQKIPLGFRSATLANDNSYIDLEFDFPAYGDNLASSPISAGDLNLVLNNGGNPITVTINSLALPDGPDPGSASPLSGGESIVRVFLDITGFPIGVETITFQPTTDNSIFSEDGDGMLSSMVSPSVTLNRAPSITNTTFTFSICTGTTTNINIQIDLPAASVSWTATASSPNLTGFSTSGTSNPIAEPIANTGNTSEQVTFSVTPKLNQISGPTVDFIVEVNPIPDMTVTNNADTICSGTNTDILLTSSNSLTVFDWTATGGTGAGGFSDGTGSTINQALTYSGTSTGLVNYVITPSIGSCLGTPQTATVNVLPGVSTPSANAITGPGNVCEGQQDVPYSSITIQGATEYEWTFTNGVDFSSGSPQNTNSITVDFPQGITTTDIMVAGKNFCGTSSTATFNVSVDAGAADPGPITGPDAICQGAQSVSFSIDPISGVDGYAWILDFIGNTPTQRFFTTTPDLTTNFGSDYQGAILTVAAYNVCDTSKVPSTKDLQATVLPGQAQTPTGPDATCTDTEVTITVPEISNATQYNWELPAEFSPVNGSATTNLNSITVNTGTTTNIFNVNVTGSNDCGSGIRASSSYRLNVQSSPDPGITLPESAYLGQLIEFTGSENSGQQIVSWTWDFGDGNGSEGQTVNHVYEEGNIYTITLQATNDVDCQSSTDALLEVIDELPVTIMNVITPNGDGSNDGVYIDGIELFPDNTVSVLNRMGVEILSLDNYDNNWTGQNLKDGNYIVIFRVKGTKLSKNQTVSVVNQ